MSGLQITDCKVRPCAERDARLLAFATITLNDDFVVCDLKVILGPDGIFVAMPSRRRRDGSFRDIAHPLNSSVRTDIERCVLAEYCRELLRNKEQLPAPPAHISMTELNVMLADDLAQADAERAAGEGEQRPMEKTPSHGATTLRMLCARFAPEIELEEDLLEDDAAEMDTPSEAPIRRRIPGEAPQGGRRLPEAEPVLDEDLNA